MEDIVDGFHSEVEESEESMDVEPEPLSIKKEEFEILKIIKLLQKKGLLKEYIVCEKCQKLMSLVSNNKFIDNYSWRCRGNFPAHDITINIRKDSIFEDIRAPINVLYYLAFKLFLNNIGINKSLEKANEFCKVLKIHNVSNKLIIKFYRKLRNKIKKSFYLMWQRSPMALEPTDQGYPAVEIDETSIIGNSNSVIWAFGIIDRSNKEARIFCVLNDRRKETLLPLIKNKVYTNPPQNGYRDLTTQVFSDCFASYRQEDFRDMDFILHRVNHSVWFGAGHFHTNTVEGLWSYIKRITNSFSGLNFKLLTELENEGIEPKDYIND